MNYSYRQWFAYHFLIYASKCQPLILLMDGHSSHYCPDLIKRAVSEKTLLFALPPCTTHITKPLDKGAFH